MLTPKLLDLRKFGWWPNKNTTNAKLSKLLQIDKGNVEKWKILIGRNKIIIAIYKQGPSLLLSLSYPTMGIYSNSMTWLQALNIAHTKV